MLLGEKARGFEVDLHTATNNALREDRKGEPAFREKNRREVAVRRVEGAMLVVGG